MEEISAESGVAILAEAAQVLREGGLVAFPTETVYGLGGNALDDAAVQAIFTAKQRPSWDPLIVHVAGWSMLEMVVASISPQARSLMRAFWPGPLTLLLPRSYRIPDAVTAGRPLVAVRWPSHPLAQALISAAGCPIAAPSANLFGHVSPTTADHVLADLNGRIAMVLDGGPTALGLESCVIDPNSSPPTLYRPGTISLQQLESVVGPVARSARPESSADAESHPSVSPGSHPRHYAPRARVILVDTEAELAEAAEREQASGATAGVMLPDGWSCSPQVLSFAWGDWHDADALSRRLYAGLRWLDEHSIAVILCPLPAAKESDALRDRLVKAARGRV